MNGDTRTCEPTDPTGVTVLPTASFIAFAADVRRAGKAIPALSDVLERSRSLFSGDQPDAPINATKEKTR